MRLIGVLSRYLIRQNLYLMAICLAVGTCIYLLSDIFDRLDDFIRAGLGAETILFYFIVKIPLIVSQLMPAVFLLAMVIQLGVLSRSREMLALRAGGVSFAWFIRFFVIYALVWSGGQLVFSQFLGVFGEYEANRIWKEDVRKKQLDELTIKDLWFRDGPFIVMAKEAHPGKSRASDITVYEFTTDNQELIRILTAKKALIDDHGWGLLDVHELDTRTFIAVDRLSQFLSVRQNLKAYAAVELKGDTAQLPLFELSKAIKRLEESGSNVEILRTVWHGKFSYACSMMVMALLALALVTWSENVYANIGLSLILIFVQYGVHVVGATAGEKGVLPPIIAAWLGNAIMGGAASLRLAWVSLPGFQATVLGWVEGLIPRRA
ncbi:LptF/LptG family permease [Pseudodesulfovibrio indicus]|uniref:LPS export ABC transporter permease LptG n=1 Tax=Pseudodesulfovibrio indicus TaxID=1716143 RepID=A0A126QQ20_9BACT|nr:LptF/LptG family permease [Pseudodesulfovibrio indicus]AMK11818.1 LPS export ABC transporter permease LptG [Pseudodesulfovibrio indicus]TDT88360.1 lipopolysaccharide export system permease protein [Pseudodesulfovibrio indicus]